MQANYAEWRREPVPTGHGLANVETEITADPFEQLFTREYARVVAIAVRITADLDEAEDVAQDAFVSFHRAHPPDAPYAAAWLHRAAVHTALNVIRGNSRRLRRETTQVWEAAQGGESLDPLRLAESKELQRDVRAALSRLSTKSAAVLTLRYSGLSYAEVAAALGVGINQVGTLLKRAEDALRKELTHRGTS
ncbi:MAG: RNA polymerase sigma factor [Chloroflexota bacterium]